MRVVCDTNILVSAFLFPGGAPSQVLNLVRLGAVTLCLSPDIVSEFRRVLEIKFRYSREEAGHFVERITRIARMVYPKERLVVISRVDADNRILECAVEAAADFLVTGDKRDILPLQRIGSTRIITARQLLDLLQHEG